MGGDDEGGAVQLAFFHRDGGRLVGTDVARSMWGPDHLHGVAVSAALARALEQRLLAEGREDLHPSRYTVDLFRPATTAPCTFETSVVRQGPRICLIDVTMLQGGEAVARAGAVFLRPTANPIGEVWSPADRPSPPPPDIAPGTDRPHIPFFHSDAGWSQDFSEHQNESRKTTWQVAVPVVAGEQPSGFVAVAGLADAASMVTNWGSKGVEYINTDITLTLARLPVGLEIGLAAADRVEHDGIAVGTATVFDRTGPLGSAMVSALANSRRTVAFREKDLPAARRGTAGA